MSTTIRRTSLPLLALALFAGCGSGDQPKFPELSPVKGVVQRGGQPVKGGVIRFTPDPDKPEFLTNSEVGADGTYSLSTVRTTDKSGERKSGAPPGKYKVTYTPPLGDQAAGGDMSPIPIAAPVEVKAGENDLKIDVPTKK